jgi:hypothetical protein
MTPERWQQIEELFQTAVDLPPSERPRYIQQAAAGDATLFEQVVALVNQFEAAGDFIEEPALGLTPLHPTDPFATSAVTGPLDLVDPSIGRRIGAYILSREVGRGGMGAVYKHSAPTASSASALPSSSSSAGWTPTSSSAASATSGRYSPRSTTRTSRAS